jgi:hypothetical protein
LSTDIAFLLLCVIAFLCAIVCIVAWKVAYRDGREAGALEERNARNEGLIYEHRAEPDPRGDGSDWDDWLAELQGAGDGERLADTGEMRMLTGYHPAGGRAVDTGSFRAAMVERTDAFIAQITSGEEAA